jgi:anti-anti-sigma factor
MSHATLQPTLSSAVQTLGDATVIHLSGRLVRGEGCTHLQEVVRGESRAGTVVLNLARLEGIDACGIGTLLRLQELARDQGTVLKLMNAVDQVHRILLLTGLDSAFNFCTVRDQFCLMQRASHAGAAA